MKKCDKHHGDITYDDTIYLECPLCKMADYDEIVKDSEELSEENDNLNTTIDGMEHTISAVIKSLEEHIR